MEPTNKMDKFAVAVIKNKKIIGHLPLGKTGRFTKTIFYFLLSLAGKGSSLLNALTLLKKPVLGSNFCYSRTMFTLFAILLFDVTGIPSLYSL